MIAQVLLPRHYLLRMGEHIFKFKTAYLKTFGGGKRLMTLRAPAICCCWGKYGEVMPVLESARKTAARYLKCSK